ncbi:MAG: hypothetical protein A3G52_01200 [Candidatus Taylorbacteria bacterium RIFCSPLOWO2_12_FULL_43_20]|uniref:Uncharacterized protein n=1 Tax=Candidatus Taylorbacteria bacterium RIFCSPLOWO2_12_FULL_43_20 TaxID=1802332 RepID=A0A1G2P3C9_9BACT|nr:MAG: hypothetical protein A2825_00595 [Candidatus Taylorbacteria bacterium RIFCSPHIGHO2_01_FULL_43_120]OHA22311.1 MAG: hypothetical protein A3B98_04320 [Candidatus Taylorbacteria bacterium RIFCSPHIGHO2_02_FULL_43_55]OHA30039.1 MAG: hypothetical protein A3E92_03285 [Candidatus Taylorbacteria bacterium RIFCSPHIGHO2_12_FULL_42_34]OHA30437.1 MAG: hypothetical protein A3B09_04345 [Candidatus Taylorbacteria bacterium RIFCSPLOWO2_01_FULL_43_83]OHA39519.1 MAG: hypothetical protein A3H58_02580 [Candi
MTLYSVLIVLTVLFLVFLGLKSFVLPKICALCATAASTWIILLATLYFGGPADPVTLGILMGGSAVGGMYYLEKKFSRGSAIFKFPFFATAVSLSYFLITRSIEFSALLTLAILWLVFIAIYITREKAGIKKFAKQIIECCRNW